MNKEKIVIMVSGGIGREIALTGVITEYAKRNPDKEVNIIAGFPDLYLNNPHINRVYPMQHQYIFDDVIKHSTYIDLEPYNDVDYYKNDKHLIEVYAKQLLGELEFIEPQIFMHEQELSKAKEFMATFKKPVLFFQPFGAMGGKFNKQCGDKEGISCADYTLIEDATQRSLTFEMTDKLYENLKEDYDIIFIRTPDQYTPKDAPSLLQPNGQPMPLRQILAAMPYIKGFISCDSFLHHAAKTMELKNGIVFWGTTKVENLGYDGFDNLTHSIDYVWLPNRQPHNNPDADKKNKELMKRAYPLEETIEKVKGIIKDWDSVQQ
jgi:hypothetical protein